ncbi:MAG: SGNH/GDSL hydrolase family protein [Nitrospirota bacterium]|nr:SGNH/GDSL hydrolase family protein [Nitrospirota bacterium]
MKKKKGILLLTLTNLSILLILVWSVNLIASLVMDGIYLYKQWNPPVSQTLYSESLPDQEYAHTIFQELRLLTKRYIPYVEWGREPFSGKTITIDQTGERVQPNVPEHPTKQVHFFGGSTMWGTGVDDQHTIPSLFNELHPDYRVYNHAQSGFVSRQELAGLINLANQDQPMDIIVFYDGCNDPLTLCRADLSLNGHREESKFIQKLERTWETPEALFGSTQTMIQKLIKKGKRPGSQCQANPAYAEKVAMTLVNNWKLAKQIANFRGAEFLAILQPVISIGKPSIHYITEEFDGSDWLAVYPHVLEIKQKEQLDWIHDFTDSFDGPAFIYIDSCHTNNLGNQIIAQKISHILETR